MKKIIGFVLIIFCLVFNYTNVLAFNEPKTISYHETLETFNNPERGFYEPLGLSLKPTNNKSLNYSSNLVHLRVNLGAFSKKNNNVSDLELTSDALNALNKTLQYIKSKGGSVIIRFAYDNFDGKANREPSLNMILRHIEQLKEVFYKNRDVIAYVELGFFGPWGEMHTSTISTTANVSLAIDKMLSSVPEEISIGVRTPNYFASWAGIDRNKLDTFKSLKGTKYYRVGLYNDGYLGSSSDLGTFANRTKEIAWLNNQAKHTLYGGEVVANFGTTPINTVEYMKEEAFITHTTYLNLRWNYNTIDNWKKEIYKGEDSLYVGETGFKYIENHLGYRFVLRNSNLIKTITNKDRLNINLDIENVGFANLINNKKVTIVLENKDNIYEIATDIDPTLWDSKNTVNIKRNITLPNNIPLGSYRVYLRISYYGDLKKDNNYKTIRLANDNIWNKEIGANYIGKINIIKYVPTNQEEIIDIQTGSGLITYEDIFTSKKEDNTNVIHNKEENKVNNNSNLTTNEVTNNTNIITNNEEIPIENNDPEIPSALIITEENPTKKNNEESATSTKEKKDIRKRKFNITNLLVIGGIIGIFVILLIIKNIKKIDY